MYPATPISPVKGYGKIIFQIVSYKGCPKINEIFEFAAIFAVKCFPPQKQNNLIASYDVSVRRKTHQGENVLHHSKNKQNKMLNNLFKELQEHKFGI